MRRAGTCLLSKSPTCAVQFLQRRFVHRGIDPFGVAAIPLLCQLKESAGFPQLEIITPAGTWRLDLGFNALLCPYSGLENTIRFTGACPGNVVERSYPLHVCEILKGNLTVEIANDNLVF